MTNMVSYRCRINIITTWCFQKVFWLKAEKERVLFHISKFLK